MDHVVPDLDVARVVDLDAVGTVAGDEVVGHEGVAEDLEEDAVAGAVGEDRVDERGVVDRAVVPEARAEVAREAGVRDRVAAARAEPAPPETGAVLKPSSLFCVDRTRVMVELSA